MKQYRHMRIAREPDGSPRIYRSACNDPNAVEYVVDLDRDLFVELSEFMGGGLIMYLAQLGDAWRPGMSDKYLAPRPWRVDRNSVDDHWTNSISIVDAEGGEVAVLTRGYEGDANGEGCPSFANADFIVKAVNTLEIGSAYLAQLGDA